MFFIFFGRILEKNNITYFNNCPVQFVINSYLFVTMFPLIRSAILLRNRFQAYANRNEPFTGAKEQKGVFPRDRQYVQSAFVIADTLVASFCVRYSENP